MQKGLNKITSTEAVTFHKSDLDSKIIQEKKSDRVNNVHQFSSIKYPP